MKVPVIGEYHNDELFYSWVLRCHKLSGNNVNAHTCKDLFDRERKNISLYIPTGTRFFIENIAAKFDLRCEDILKNNTLYPIYEPFISIESQKKIKDIYLNGNGSIINLIGVTSSNCSRISILRYCPICVKEHYTNYGVAYFIRNHQVKGVHVCTKHLCFLNEYNEEIKNLNEIDLISYSYKNLNIFEIDLNKKTDVKLLKLAEIVEFIIENVKNFNIDKVYRRYMFLLEKNNMLDSNGNTIRKNLYSRMEKIYGNEILDKLECSLGRGGHGEWLMNLSHKPKYVIDPIRHILLINILVEKIDHFFDSTNDIIYVNNKENYEKERIILYKEKLKSFIAQNQEINRSELIKTLGVEYKYIKKNAREWFDENIPSSALDEYNDDSLKRWKKTLLDYMRDNPNTSRSKIKSAYRNEYEKCKTYDRSWFESNMPISRAKYIKSFEDECKKRRSIFLEYISENPEHTRSEIVEGITNAYTWLHKNDKKWLDNHVEVGYRTRSEILKVKKKIYREKVSDYIRLNMDVNKNKIRNNLPLEYKWLYRNDREWFFANIPNTNYKYKSLITFNIWSEKWKERDEEVIMELKMNYTSIYSSAGYKKITKNYLLRNLDLNYIQSVINSIDKMPKTKAFIESVVETSEKHQLRKIKIANEEMKKDGEKILKSKLVKRAGISQVKFASVKNLINQIIRE